MTGASAGAAGESFHFPVDTTCMSLRDVATEAETGEPVLGAGSPRVLALREKPAASSYTGTAVFLGGLKKGSFTTLAVTF
jgi:hypothetical protein